jgi:hypothetical protein
VTWLVWYLVAGAVFTVLRTATGLALSSYARSRGVMVETGTSYMGNASLFFVVIALAVELAIWPITAAWTVCKFAKAAIVLTSQVLTARKLGKAEQ